MRCILRKSGAFFVGALALTGCLKDRNFLDSFSQDIMDTSEYNRQNIGPVKPAPRPQAPQRASQSQRPLQRNQPATRGVQNLSPRTMQPRREPLPSRREAAFVPAPRFQEEPMPYNADLPPSERLRSLEQNAFEQPEMRYPQAVALENAQRAQEDLDMQRAIEASYRTYEQEQARTQAQQTPPRNLALEEADRQRELFARAEAEDAARHAEIMEGNALQEQHALEAAQAQLALQAQEEERQRLMQQDAQRQAEAAVVVAPQENAPSAQQTPLTWEPNSENLRLAGENVMNLQWDLGRAPTHSEMLNAIMERQHLTHAQAEVVLDFMGL